MQENAVCTANCTVQEKRGGQKIMLIRNATLQMSVGSSPPWTRSPTETMGFWLMQVPWLERRNLMSL